MTSTKTIAVLAIFALVIFESVTCWNQKCRPGHPCGIQGPKSLDSKIAIVGAGPSGIHMAYLLKKKGFTNIKLFEARCRIGGKSFTIDYRGTPQEMGTVYLSPDYEPNIIALAKEFQVGKLADLPSATVWTDGVPLTFAKYTGKETLKFLKITNATIAAAELASAISRYVLLHQKLFGTYEGELMPRPSDKVLYLIRGSFKDFLLRNRLWILRPLFLASQTVQGYGQLDQIAAFYGLMWNTPRLMGALVARMKGLKVTGLYMLSIGFQRLWEKMAEKLTLDISFESKVIELDRHKDGVWLKYHKRRNWRRLYLIEEEHFDFVIWTPEMKLSLDAIDANDVEEELFTGTKPMYFTTSLVNSLRVPYGFTAVDYWFQLIEGKKDHVLWAQRESFAALNGFNGTDYHKGLLPTGNDHLPFRTTVVYQMGRFMPLKTLIQSKIESHFHTMGGKVKILKTTRWRYFPRYSDSRIRDGVIWDILETQGKYNMWYIGSSVSFESVKSVVEYNELLVDIMKPPVA